MQNDQGVLKERNIDIFVFKTNPLTFYSYPESNDLWFALAGLLTYSAFSAFPSQFIRNSGIVVKKHFNELTATGTAPDFNRIPFSSLSKNIQTHENQLRCKCIKKIRMIFIKVIFRIFRKNILVINMLYYTHKKKRFLFYMESLLY